MDGRKALSRRRFLRTVTVFGVTAGLAQLVACAPAAPPAPTAAPAKPTDAPAKPTEAPKPAAPAAAVPTAAPAAKAAPAATAPAAAPSGAPKRGGTLTIAVHEDITANDPFKAPGTGDILMHGLISQPLVAGNAKDEIEPVLAESFKSDDGGKVWTFNLRKGVKFHNGRELTAEDAKATFDFILNPASGATQAGIFKGIGLKSSVVDKYTFKIEIERGFGSFLSQLTTATRAAILAPEAFNADGTLGKPIGTGPFKFVDWKPGAEFRVERHDEYWQVGDDGKPLPYIDGITLKITGDATTRLNALLAGEVDYITNPAYSEVKKWVDGKPPAGIAFFKWFYNYSDYMGLNSRRPPFDDARVRQAVRHTLDRAALNEAIYFGLGEVHNQPFKQASHWYLDVPTPKPDLARARQLMQEAGLGGGVEMTMLVWTPAYEKRAEVVQAQLSQIGIRSKLDKRDPANFVKHLPTFDWDMATLVIGTIFHPDRPYGYLDSSHGSNPNVGGHNDKELDALLAQARDEADFAKAKAMYRTVVEKHVEEFGTPQYLMNLPLVHAFRDHVQGFSAYGYDLVAINASMGLHKSWIAK